jgi:ABC-2 type transport system permease protein
VVSTSEPAAARGGPIRGPIRGLIRGLTGGWAGGPSIALLAVIRRDWRDHRLFRVPFLLDLVFGTINMAVFLLVTRWLVAGPQAMLHFHYVALGLAFLLALQGAVHQAVQRITQEQRTGTLEFQVASGVRPWAILGGLAVVPAAAGQLRMLLYLALAGLLLDLRLGAADWPGVVVVVGLSGALCVGLAATLAALAVAVPGGATAGRVAIAALGLVSGVFVPLDQLPPALCAIGSVLPTTAALDGLRLVFGGAVWGPAALALSGWVVAVGLVAAAASGVAVRVARRRGALVPS